MALGAGGTMRQKIYPDPHGLAVWDPDNRGRARLEIVNSAGCRELTGREPPATPIDAATYTEHGLPWFDLYDEAKATVGPEPGTPRLRTVGERDAERGIARDDDPVDEPQVETIRPGRKRTKE